METIQQVLTSKSDILFSIAPEASVLDAVKLMAEKGVGALLVMEGEHLAGIISERDYARKVILRGRSSHTTQVREIMTGAPLYTVGMTHTAQDCMAIMTERRIRHLPVLSDGRVVGVLSIGDLVKAVIAEQKETIKHLEHYISGNEHAAEVYLQN
jgi:CBS domain-containing protein